MKKLEYPKELQALADRWRGDKLCIACVPTMGYLHNGHVSLVKKARSKSDRLVVSIFVNPIQFGENEDLSVYPRDLENDFEILRNEGVDCVFVPSVKAMYPKPPLTFVDVKGLTDNLCGSSRENHFQGVTTVVAKLFNIIKPHIAYFGQKDYQQYIVIKRMVEDLNFDIDIRLGDIVRHQDGLAMSSRNTYLSKADRTRALALWRSLVWAREKVSSGERSVDAIRKGIVEILEASSVNVDYVELVDSVTLGKKKEISGTTLIALAAFVGNVRLIDNILVSAA